MYVGYAVCVNFAHVSSMKQVDGGGYEVVCHEPGESGDSSARS